MAAHMPKLSPSLAIVFTTCADLHRFAGDDCSYCGEGYARHGDDCELDTSALVDTPEESPPGGYGGYGGPDGAGGYGGVRTDLTARHRP